MPAKMLAFDDPRRPGTGTLCAMIRVALGPMVPHGRDRRSGPRCPPPGRWFHVAVIAELVLDVRNEGKENLKAGKDEGQFCR